LSEAIELALRKNEGLVIERESVASAKAAVRRANGAYDPLLEADGAWSKSTEPSRVTYPGGPIAPEFESGSAGLGIRQLLPTGGALSLRARGIRETVDDSLYALSPAYRTQLGAELRQPLLRDRSIDEARLSVRVASADRAGATASLRRAVTETVAAVERAYWGLAEARLTIGVREEAVRLAEDQLEDTRHRVESGDAPNTELAQPRAELERRRGDLFASREALARAENTLKLLILDGADDPLWSAQLGAVEESVDVRDVDVGRSLERALSERPELEMAESRVVRRRAETAFAKDGIQPDLDAVLSYDRFGLAGSSNTAGALPLELDGRWDRSWESLERGTYDAARIALVLQLPIGNREARGNAEVARHAERQAEIDVERIRKGIRAEVLDAAAGLETAGQRMEAARSGREAAEIQLSAERDRYDAGLSINFLVLTRQNDLSRAKLDEINARTDYRNARTEMARATGRLMDERGIEIDNGTTH
jgi:outer membrane protein